MKDEGGTAVGCCVRPFPSLGQCGNDVGGDGRFYLGVKAKAAENSPIFGSFVFLDKRPFGVVNFRESLNNLNRDALAGSLEHIY